MKDVKFVFVYGQFQCEINNCKRAGNLLPIYHNNISKVFEIYDRIYDKSNILFIDEARYHSGHNREENCFKIPPSWEYDGSLERDRLIWSNICNSLIHWPKINMKRYLKMLTNTVHGYSF